MVQSYASQLLKPLETSLDIVQTDSIIGVPLQLFILSVVSRISAKLDFVLQFLNSDQPLFEQHTLEFSNIFKLYGMFVEEKLSNFIGREIRICENIATFSIAQSDIA